VSYQTNSTPPGWYPDPFGRHEHRWFDGAQWTDQVASHGNQRTDPPVGGSPVPTTGYDQNRIEKQVHQQAGLGAVPQGGGTLYTEPVLVVNQKTKLIEVNNEYAIFDQRGTQIGAVRQVGQSTAKKVARVLTSMDQFFTHTLQIVDAYGNVVLVVTRPRKVMKSRFLVQDGQGRELGQIVQDNVFGKIHFTFESGGHKVGSMNAENWRAWNFNIQDHSGAEVARITKTWEGLARTLFTTADNYVVQIHRQLAEPLHSMVLASALTVDTALKQDSRGFG
jgi:uncharacterized protein YxjI